MAATTHDDLDLRVRMHVYECFVGDGRPPSVAETARHLDERPAAIEASLRRLADQHVIVLAGGGTSIWMAAPFSAVPTEFRVEVDGRRWWANCIWDGLGVIALLGGTGRLETSCPDCGEPLEVVVHDGRPPDRDWVVHFAVPAAQWWEDIGFT